MYPKGQYLDQIDELLAEKQRKFEEGMEHYKSALKYVEQSVMQARLAFNLGLGYMRWKKPEKATEWLEKSATLGGSEFSKAGDQGY